MRGKPQGDHTRRAAHRIIPAHAGQTELTWLFHRHPTDHPRACGANAVISCYKHSCSGSSPRMRGKLGVHVRGGLVARIIPAHAGQTSIISRESSIVSDHPRACGANLLVVWVSAHSCGSSPRMRGKRRCESCRKYAIRIIPAHAGQTRCQRERCRSHPDHPRACGANPLCRCSRARNCGSSPRMRGKQLRRELHKVARRIIPAHAGQTGRGC